MATFEPELFNFYLLINQKIFASHMVCVRVFIFSDPVFVGSNHVPQTKALFKFTPSERHEETKSFTTSLRKLWFVLLHS